MNEQIIKKDIEIIADAFMSLIINDKNCEFYKQYKESGMCMYDFVIEWLQEK